jgi:DNA processing protein
MLGVGAGGPVGEPRSGSHAARGPWPDGGAAAPDLASAMAERDAWAVLAGVHRLGPVGFGALLARYGSGLAILREAGSPGGAGRLAETGLEPGLSEAAPERRRLGPVVATAIADAAVVADRTLARLRSLGIRVVTVDDDAYPRRLAAIEMPPHVLFVLGDPAALDGRAAVAIVGTRRATDAGRSIAARIATNLVAVGATVVSGLAIGIDGAAHAATVRAGGRTVAVIGSGHAVLQPSSHSRLAASIIDAGGAVVSELAPDVEATRGTFPRRNRVISGLADATVVVEAPARSGALITASWALEQGRECFLVPGPLGAPASEGCLAFLREFPDEARIVAGIPQLLDDLGLAEHLAGPGLAPGAGATLADVGDAAARVGRELVLGRATVDELVAVTGWPVASVLAALTLLERRGLAVGVHGRFRPAGGLAGADPAGARAAARGRR